MPSKIRAEDGTRTRYQLAFGRMDKDDSKKIDVDELLEYCGYGYKQDGGAEGTEEKEEEEEEEEEEETEDSMDDDGQGSQGSLQEVSQDVGMQSEDESGSEARSFSSGEVPPPTMLQVGIHVLNLEATLVLISVFAT